jgi:uncharacterized protein YukE
VSTELEELRAESRALVTFGVARYEDSVVFSAVRRYLVDVGQIPTGAWGTLPGISDKLRRDWATALENRVSEAVTIRDEMTRISDGILQIAANYDATDLRVATSFDLANQDLRPFLAAADGYANEIRVRPGGVGVLPQQRYPKLADGPPAVVIPPDNERLSAIRQERLPHVRHGEEPLRIGFTNGVMTIAGGPTVHYENGEKDRLDQFVQEHRDTLLQLEALLIELGTGRRLPLNDLIVHAWRSSPSIIRNRADLVHSAANTYQELRTAMDGELSRLNLYWEGSAAKAFTQHVQSVSSYLSQLEIQARWLAEEGKKAASSLEGLRNAYATTGYERIGSLITALTEYHERISKPFHSCGNLEQALIDAAAAFTDHLLSSERRYTEELTLLLQIDEQERRERPDIGTRGHDAIPFPKVETGAEAWYDDGGWRPSPHRPAV